MSAGSEARTAAMRAPPSARVAFVQLDVVDQPDGRGVVQDGVRRGPRRAGRLRAWGTRRRAWPSSGTRTSTWSALAVRLHEHLDRDVGRDVVRRAIAAGQRAQTATAASRSAFLTRPGPTVYSGRLSVDARHAVTRQGDRMMRMRNVLIGAAFVAGIVVLGVGQDAARAARGRAGEGQRVRRRGSKWIRSGPSRCRTTGFSARRSASAWTSRITSGSSIAAAATLDPKELWGAGNPPASDCCAAAPPVLEFDQAGNLLNHWGGPGEGYEWPESNHGITVDSKGIVWIGGNGAIGRPHPEVHARRKVREAVRLPVRERRQQRHVGVRPRREDLPRRAEQRGVRRRRLRQQARRRHRHGQRQDQALLGRVRQQARRRQPRSVQSRRAARAAVPQSGALRRAVERRARLRVRSRQRSRAGVHARTARS